jgi:hypothetical protein
MILGFVCGGLFLSVVEEDSIAIYDSKLLGAIENIFGTEEYRALLHASSFIMNTYHGNNRSTGSLLWFEKVLAGCFSFYIVFT